MAGVGGVHSVFLDGLAAILLVRTAWSTLLTARADRRQVGTATWRRNVTSWVYIPVGLLLMLLACFGVNILIGLSFVSFPASVACMIVLFFALIACDFIIGDRRTREIVNVINIPVCLIHLF
jgi:hypothetical protein